MQFAKHHDRVMQSVLSMQQLLPQIGSHAVNMAMTVA